MGFNKKQHLQQNIDALRVAFRLEKEKQQATISERLSLMQYSGFGGLKFVLNPIADETDINHWRKNDHDLFPITQELYQLLKDKTTVEQLQLIQQLEEEDKQTIFKLIDKMLTNKKFKDFFQKNVAAL